jgi:hypothetical protein
MFNNIILQQTPEKRMGDSRKSTRATCDDHLLHVKRKGARPMAAAIFDSLRSLCGVLTPKDGSLFHNSAFEEASVQSEVQSRMVAAVLQAHPGQFACRPLYVGCVTTVRVTCRLSVVGVPSKLFSLV